MRRAGAQPATPAPAPDPALANLGKMGGGKPMPEDVRVRFEAAFDHDFSGVRIHFDNKASKAADGLSALAFALGRDIFFGPGQWNPGSREGDRLIAHELTHVVQFDTGRLAAGGGVSSPSDPAEQEARANEGRILALLPPVGAIELTRDASIPEPMSARLNSTAGVTAGEGQANSGRGAADRAAAGAEAVQDRARAVGIGAGFTGGLGHTPSAGAPVGGPSGPAPVGPIQGPPGGGGGGIGAGPGPGGGLGGGGLGGGTGGGPL
jgi:hypothetical protein